MTISFYVLIKPKEFVSERYTKLFILTDASETVDSTLSDEYKNMVKEEKNVLEQLSDGTSLVVCRIEHGRTHQIRVHMALTGHPIAGDRMYGPPEEAGEIPLMLHAYRAGFRQPFTGEEIRIEAPLPDWAGAVKEKLTGEPDGEVTASSDREEEVTVFAI